MVVIADCRPACKKKKIRRGGSIWYSTHPLRGHVGVKSDFQVQLLVTALSHYKAKVAPTGRAATFRSRVGLTPTLISDMTGSGE